MTTVTNLRATATLGLLACSVPAQSAPLAFRVVDERPVLAADVSLLYPRAAVGDLTGDGWPDVVFGHPGLLVNQRGHWRDESTARLGAVTAGAAPQSVLVRDLDANGDQDLVVLQHVRGVAEVRVWMQAAGALVEGFVLTPTGPFADVEAADLDGDGDLDLVLSGGTTEALAQLVPGVFSVRPSPFPTGAGPLGQLTPADVDSDGDTDWLTTTGLVLRNQGGVLQADPASGLAVTRSSGIGDYPLTADLDGDGDADVLVNDTPYLNDGTGRFSAGASLPLPRGFEPRALTDINGDGNIDVLCGAWQPDPQIGSAGLVFRNDGRAGFSTLPVVVPTGASAVVAAVGADLDRDGDGDLLLMDTTRGGRKWIAINDGRFLRAVGLTPRFPAPWPGLGPHAVAADLDFDGDPEWISLGVVYRNSGAGEFTVAQSGLPRGPLAVGDVDADGDLDLVIGAAPSALWLNDGTGTLFDATAGRLLDAERHRELCLVDLDRDGDLDLVTATAPDASSGTAGLNRVFLNTGNGVFLLSVVAIPAVAAASTAVATGDFDGDGDVDLAFANDDAPDVLYGNDGSARFSRSTGFAPPDEGTRTLIAVDVEGDGDTDLLAGLNAGSARLWINDGSGGFADEGFLRLPVPLTVGHATAGDIDDDGDTDLALVTGVGPLPTLLVNDGLGRFANVTPQRLEVALSPAPATRVHLVDVDTDGDLDLGVSLSGAFAPRGSLFINHHRQLTVPSVWSLGTRLTMRLTMEPGYDQAPRFALPLIANRALHLPLGALGTLGPDPTRAAPLPLLTLARGVAEVELAVAIPNQPALRGLPLWLQALAIDSLGGARLTHTVADRVR